MANEELVEYSELSWYIDHFNAHLEATGRHLGCTSGAEANSQLLGSGYQWSPTEKDAFFGSLRRRGKSRADLIHSDMKNQLPLCSKTLLDVYAYLHQLDQESVKHDFRKGDQKYLTSRCREASQKWIDTVEEPMSTKYIEMEAEESIEADQRRRNEIIKERDHWYEERYAINVLKGRLAGEAVLENMNGQEATYIVTQAWKISEYRREETLGLSHTTTVETEDEAGDQFDGLGDKVKRGSKPWWETTAWKETGTGQGRLSELRHAALALVERGHITEDALGLLFSYTNSSANVGSIRNILDSNPSPTNNIACSTLVHFTQLVKQYLRLIIRRIVQEHPSQSLELEDFLPSSEDDDSSTSHSETMILNVDDSHVWKAVENLMDVWELGKRKQEEDLASGAVAEEVPADPQEVFTERKQAKGKRKVGKLEKRGHDPLNICHPASASDATPSFPPMGYTKAYKKQKLPVSASPQPPSTSPAFRSADPSVNEEDGQEIGECSSQQLQQGPLPPINFPLRGPVNQPIYLPPSSCSSLLQDRDPYNVIQFPLDYSTNSSVVSLEPGWEEFESLAQPMRSGVLSSAMVAKDNTTVAPGIEEVILNRYDDQNGDLVYDSEDSEFSAAGMNDIMASRNKNGDKYNQDDGFETCCEIDSEIEDAIQDYQDSMVDKLWEARALKNLKKAEFQRGQKRWNGMKWKRVRFFKNWRTDNAEALDGIVKDLTEKAQKDGMKRVQAPERIRKKNKRDGEIFRKQLKRGGWKGIREVKQAARDDANNEYGSDKCDNEEEEGYQDGGDELKGNDKDDKEDDDGKEESDDDGSDMDIS